MLNKFKVKVNNNKVEKSNMGGNFERNRYSLQLLAKI